MIKEIPKKRKEKKKKEISDKKMDMEFKVWCEGINMKADIQDDYFMIDPHLFEDIEMKFKDGNLRKSENIIVSENDYSDYIIISDERQMILTDEEWREIFKTQSLQSQPRRNIFYSLQHGIPHKIRKDLWPLLAGIDELKLITGKSYQELSEKECGDEYDIKKDLLRTYPGHKFFDPSKKSEKHLEDGVDQLFRILRAYSNLDPSLGYTQGMNFIVAVLLINLDPYKDKNLNEEKKDIDFIDNLEETVFWIFVHIMQKKGWKGVFADGTPRLFDLLKKFNEKLQKNLPKVSKHFEEHNIEVIGTFSQYFLTLLMYKTPLKTSKRIMDVFLLG